MAPKRLNLAYSRHPMAAIRRKKDTWTLLNSYPLKQRLLDVWERRENFARRMQLKTKNACMRDSNKHMIELIDVSRANSIYSSLIRHQIAGEELHLRFGIEPIDFGHLNRILEFRPFEHTGVSPYRYFFNLAYRKDSDNTDLFFVKIRVEQLDRHKEFDFKISKKYLANLLWFNKLTDKKLVEQMIEQ